MDIEEIHDAPPEMLALAEHLGGNGVPSIEAAGRERLLEPLREAFGALVTALVDGGEVPDVRHRLVDELSRFDCEFDATTADLADIAGPLRDPDLGDLVLARVRADLPDTASAGFRRIAAAALVAARIDCSNGAGTKAAFTAALSRLTGGTPSADLLLPVSSHYRWAHLVDRAPMDEALAATIGTLTSDPAVADCAGVHDHGGIRWFRGEQWSELVTGLLTAALATAPSKAAARRAGNVARELVRAAERSGSDWDRMRRMAEPAR